MGAIVTGNVKVTIETKGTGDGAAHMEKAASAAKKLKSDVGATGDEATKSAGKFGELWKGLKFGAGVLATLGLPGVIAGIVSAVGSLIATESEYERTTKLATERTKDFTAALQELEGITSKHREDTQVLTKEEERVNSIREKQVKNIIAMSQAAGELQVKQNALNATNARLAEIYDQIRRRTAQIIENDKQRASGLDLYKKKQDVYVETDQISDLLIKQASLVRDIKRAQEDLGGVMGVNLLLASQTTEEFARTARIIRGGIGGLAAAGKGVVIGKGIGSQALAGILSGAGGGVSRPSGGGGGGVDLLGEWKARMASYGPSNDNSFTDRDYRMLLRKISGDDGLGVDENGQRLLSGGLTGKHEEIVAENRRNAIKRVKIADTIRDFSAALSEAIPGMDKFAGALSQITDIWDKWAETGKDTGKAIVGSLAAIGLAGAEQIKNERLRAGVKALIYGAEGAAHVLTPGMQAQGIAELGAAAVLGGIAIFGGSSGGGKRAGAGGSNNIRPITESRGSGTVIYNINAPWFGPAPQESAAGVVAFTRRANGTGFGSRG